MPTTDGGDEELGRRLWVYAVDMDECDAETARDLGKRARELVLLVPKSTDEVRHARRAVPGEQNDVDRFAEQLAAELGLDDELVPLIARRTEELLTLLGINTPHTVDFLKAVEIEAAHQRAWRARNDDLKTPGDWFGLIECLAGKALLSASHGDRDQSLRHSVSCAAVLLRLHGRIGSDPKDGEHGE
jgi:hypothetical protein